MKIIDEKGRLFGKINIIDFLVILFLFCIIPVFYFGYRIFSIKLEAPAITKLPTVASIDCYCVAHNLTPEIAEHISVGDKDYDRKNNVVGEILAIGKPEEDSYVLSLGGGRTIFYQDPTRRQLLIKARLLGEIKDSVFYYKEKEFSIGSNVDLNIYKDNKISCIVESVEGSKDVLSREFKSWAVSATHLDSVELNIDLKAIDPDKVNTISLGDTFIDDAGNKLGEILNVGEPTTYSYTVDLGGGNIVSRHDPSRRQILIKARLLGEVKDNVFYYQGEKVAVGSKISLKTSKYNISGIIKSEPKRTSYLDSVELNIDLKAIDPDKVSSISLGDTFLDDTGAKLGEILNVGEPTTYSYTVDLGGGNVVSRQDPTRKQLLIKVRLLGEVKDNVFYYQGEKIGAGFNINLKTNKYNIAGIVKSEPKPMLTQSVLIRVKLKNLMPEVIGSISVDDQEKDKEGNSLMEVKSIISNIPSEVMVQEGGSIHITEHPRERDVILLINALCIKEGKKLILKDKPVKIGGNIILSTDKYDINGTIISIEKVEK